MADTFEGCVCGGGGCAHTSRWHGSVRVCQLPAPTNVPPASTLSCPLATAAVSAHVLAAVLLKGQVKPRVPKTLLAALVKQLPQISTCVVADDAGSAGSGVCRGGHCVPCSASRAYASMVVLKPVILVCLGQVTRFWVCGGLSLYSKLGGARVC